MERDLARLEAFYRQGYDETMGRMAELEAWLRGQPAALHGGPPSGEVVARLEIPRLDERIHLRREVPARTPPDSLASRADVEVKP